MPRKLIAFAAVAVGVLALVLLMQSQSGPVQQYLGPRHWPPFPEEMVNVLNVSVVPPGGTGVLYSVPTDQWLVVTAVGGQVFNSNVDLCEDLGGVLTVKVGTVNLHTVPVVPVDGQGPIGWAFRPGSNVVLRNPGPQAAGINGFTMLGYLAR